MRPDPRLAGLALAGGRSRRFGTEKAAALFEGQPLLIRAVETLRGACGAVAVSARPGSAAEAMAEGLGLAVLHDIAGAPEGPLAGVAAGIAWAAAAGADRLAVLPCDTPRVSVDILLRLAAALGPEDGAAAVRAPDGVHALCAVIRVASARPLMEMLDRGEHPPVAEAWARLGLVPVDFPDAAPFANLNRPEELTALEDRG